MQVSSPKGRAGIPISVKLILTTSVVLAVAVAAATWFSQRSIDELANTQIAARRASGQASITRESELAAEAVSNGVAHALANNQYDDISPVLDGALRENNRLTWIAVTDDTGQLVRATVHAPNAAGVLELDKLLATAPAGEVVHARIGTGSDWVYGAPVKIGRQKVGALRMAVTTAGLDAELAKSLAEADDR